MSLQTWVEAAAVQPVANTKNTWTANASIIHPTALITLPANFWSIGRSVRVTATGGISNLVTAQCQFTFTMNVGSTIVWTSGAISSNTAAHTNIPFYLNVLLTCRAIGSSTSANFMGQGRITTTVLTIGAGGDTTTSQLSYMLPNTAAAVGSGFDSTTSQTFGLAATCQTSNAGNAINVEQYVVEFLN